MHNYDAQQHRAGQIISALTLQTIIIAVRDADVNLSGLKCFSSDSRVSMLATLVNANFCSSGKCLNTAFYVHKLYIHHYTQIKLNSSFFTVTAVNV